MRDGIILLALCQSNYCAAAAGPLTNAQAHLRNGSTDENFWRSELSKGAQQPRQNHNDAGISLAETEMYVLKTTLSTHHSGAYVPAHAVNCAGGLRNPSVPGWCVHSALNIG